MLCGIWHNRQLLRALIWRDIQGRYRGSVLGLAWSFVNPLILLVLYTFVFTVVFKARWGAASVGEDRTHFAQMLFVGMVVHGIVAEVLQRAPAQIVSQPNYVKKVVFPLEILPLVAVGSALAHALAGLIVLVLAFLTLRGHVPLTAALLPIVWVPLLLMVSGAAWLLASIGVFVRDTGQLMVMVSTVLLFASPIFYPLSALPVALQPYLALNPLAWVIEQSRAVLVVGVLPDWQGLAIWTALSACIAAAGFALFQKTRQGFADVL